MVLVVFAGESVIVYRDLQLYDLLRDHLAGNEVEYESGMQRDIGLRTPQLVVIDFEAVVTFASLHLVEALAGIEFTAVEREVRHQSVARIEGVVDAEVPLPELEFQLEPAWMYGLLSGDTVSLHGLEPSGGEACALERPAP